MVTSRSVMRGSIVLALFFAFLAAILYCRRSGGEPATVATRDILNELRADTPDSADIQQNTQSEKPSRKEEKSARKEEKSARKEEKSARKEETSARKSKKKSAASKNRQPAAPAPSRDDYLDEL